MQRSLQLDPRRPRTAASDAETMQSTGRIAGEFVSMAAAARAIAEYREGDALLHEVLRRIRTTADARHFYSAWSGAALLLNPSDTVWHAALGLKASPVALLIVAPDPALLRDGSLVHPVLTAAGGCGPGARCDLRASGELPAWTGRPLRIDDLRGR